MFKLTEQHGYRSELKLENIFLMHGVISFPDGMSYGPQSEKTCLREFGNNTGTDLPAHRGSLISAFAIRFLESYICKLATGEISIF